MFNMLISMDVYMQRLLYAQYPVWTIDVWDDLDRTKKVGRMLNMLNIHGCLHAKATVRTIPSMDDRCVG